MSKYNKAWVAIAGAAGIALVDFGVLDAGQWEAITSSVISLLAAFGVYQIPNTEKT